MAKYRNVSKELACKLTSLETEEILFFIDRNHGIKRGWIDQMNFNVSHPTKTDMCQINIILKLI